MKLKPVIFEKEHWYSGHQNCPIFLWFSVIWLKFYYLYFKFYYLYIEINVSMLKIGIKFKSWIPASILQFYFLKIFREICKNWIISEIYQLVLKIKSISEIICRFNYKTLIRMQPASSDYYQFFNLFIIEIFQFLELKYQFEFIAKYILFIINILIQYILK